MANSNAATSKISITIAVDVSDADLAGLARESLATGSDLAGLVAAHFLSSKAAPAPAAAPPAAEPSDKRRPGRPRKNAAKAPAKAAAKSAAKSAPKSSAKSDDKRQATLPDGTKVAISSRGRLPTSVQAAIAEGYKFDRATLQFSK